MIGLLPSLCVSAFLSTLPHYAVLHILLVCLHLLVTTVRAQINVTLYNDSNCVTPLPSTALLFNSVQAWSSLSTSQLVSPVSNLTSSSCQSTAALQQAGVGVGVMRALRSAVPQLSESTTEQLTTPPVLTAASSQWQSGRQAVRPPVPHSWLLRLKG